MIGPAICRKCNTVLYRLGVNETENLVEKVLNEAFETVTSVKEGVEILDVFYQYTPRQRIRIVSIVSKTFVDYLIIDEYMMILVMITIQAIFPAPQPNPFFFH